MTRRQKVAAAAGTATLTAACASTQASTSWRRPRPGAVALHKDGRAAYAATQIMTIESAPSRAAERGDHPGRPRQFGMTMTLSVIAQRARTIHAQRSIQSRLYQIDRYLGCCRWVVGHAEQPLGESVGESRALS